MDVTVLLEPKIDLQRLTKVLDELGHEGRLHTIYGWDRARQAALFEACAGYRPLTLDHFVPPSVGPLVEVIHDGKNTLPAFTHFQKRFCKPKDEEDPPVLYGYNHQTFSGVTGPGYFVARKSEREGEIAIDYRTLPKAKVECWPPIVPNSARLGRLVYEGMVDHMRGLSSHVSVGRAEKGGKMMDAWFVLVRRDVD